MTSWRAHDPNANAFEGRCDYCGRRCTGHVCPAHRDAAQAERDLMPSNVQSPPRSLAETCATGSERKEA